MMTMMMTMMMMMMTMIIMMMTMMMMTMVTLMRTNMTRTRRSHPWSVDSLGSTLSEQWWLSEHVSVKRLAQL